jgi:hypothetical protein
MRVTPVNTKSPLGFNQLPQEIRAICDRLLDGLNAGLKDNLYGIYLYGAMVFPETRYIQDIDFHVIVKRKLSEPEKESVIKLHDQISEEFHISKDDLDGYYILLEDAGQIKTPWHQVYPDIPDDSWPLHIAHMRAGYCIVLYGPEPGTLLPEPTWNDLKASLDTTLKSTLEYMDVHPAYCILNFCRLLYSYTTRDVVVSKRGAADWVIKNYPEWKELVESALRVLEREERDGDRSNVQAGISGFQRFITGKIEESE